MTERKYIVPFEGRWKIFAESEIQGWEAGDSSAKKLAKHIREQIADYECNKLHHFLPHGMAWREHDVELCGGRFIVPKSKYPKEWKNDGVAFLNSEADIAVVLAPNQVGKTTLGACWSLLHLIPTEKDWPIFKYTGVQWKPWLGPKIWIIASYSWDNVNTLWKRYSEYCPVDELKEYSPYYNGKGKKYLILGDGKPKRVRLACGSIIIPLCYTQQQMHWEGYESDGFQGDEQVPKEKWVGWARSTTTRGDYTPCCMTLTGHVLDERPDTGASGWIKREICDNTNRQGQSVDIFHLSIESTPDAIISPKKKKELWNRFCDPEVNRTEKDERAAIARYWGGWEEGSGLVFDEFQKGIHVINPLFNDDKVPRDWTKWRVVDYGAAGVSCCSWWAVSPKGFIVNYRNLYERGLLVNETCQKIIEMSHNRMVASHSDTDPRTGNTYQYYIEECVNEVYYATILDSRSCAQAQQGETIADLFARYGVSVVAASGQKNEIQMPRLKDMLRVDPERQHLTRKNRDGTPYMGAPQLYLFESCAKFPVMEFEGLQIDPNDPSKIKAKQDDHWIDTAKYFASENPRYMGDFTGENADEQLDDFGLAKANRFTAY